MPATSRVLWRFTAQTIHAGSAAAATRNQLLPKLAREDVWIAGPHSHVLPWVACVRRGVGIARRPVVFTDQWDKRWQGDHSMLMTQRRRLHSQGVGADKMSPFVVAGSQGTKGKITTSCVGLS